MKTYIKSIACALALTTTVAFAHPTEEKKPANFEVSAFVSADNNIRVAIKKNVPERVQVSLRDASGNIIYSHNLTKKDMSYAAKLDVSDLNDGVYQLEIVSGAERITKKLNLSSKQVEVQRKVTVQ
ncbi:MAG: T9SS type A sorting domain-containing protein [Spirosomaceae bacterium]|jgi:hypothetical protein|nr:T9SS type A sorting domain-containing protein [Spirosomataceae bacterium]